MMDEIRERLLRRDYLYADADAYRAGVEAALAALRAQPPVRQVVGPATPMPPRVLPDAPEGHVAEAMATAVGHA